MNADAESTRDLSASFPRAAVRSGVRCADWREAVRASGELLVATGAASEDYVDAIVEAVERLGPYIVLAPGIALAHARPEDGGLAVGFSLVKLAEPVEFGAANNDPVDLVFAFATPDSDQHITALSALAEFIESGDNLARIRAADNDEELYRVIEEAYS
ncbi:MAG: PTS sugar transporter subunit IIA [Actinomycetota bacterium]